mgnify:CR=1 FL=1
MANLSSTIKLKLDSSSVKRGTEDMKARFKKVGKAMAASMAIGAVAIVGMFNKFRHEMDRIGKLSQRLEEAPETLQRIGLAAELAGADLETVVKGAQKFVRSVVEAAEGSKIYKRAMDVLGLSAKDLLELPLEDQLIALSDAYVNSGKGGAELAAIQDLLGKQGVELLPLLRMGPEALTKAMREAKVVTGETIDEMQEFNDEMTIVGNDLQVKLAPFFKWLARSLTGLIDYMTAFLDTWKELGRAAGDIFSGDIKTGAGRLKRVATGDIIKRQMEGPVVPKQVLESPQSKLLRLRDQYNNSVDGRGSGTVNEQRLFDEMKALMVQLRENKRTAVQY